MGSTRTKPLRTSCTRLKKGSEEIRRTWLTKLQKHQQLPQINRVCQKHLQSNKGPYQAAPPPQQQQQPGPGGQTVIVQYMNPPAFGHSPVNMVCPHCQAQIRTTTDSEPGPLAWILARYVRCWIMDVR